MDPYLALTPLLLLGIIGLIRFIGCNQVYGLDETKLKVDPVGDLDGDPADRRVTLKWSYPSSSNISGFRVDVAGGPFDPPIVDVAAKTAIVNGLTNGVVYTFSVFAERGTDVSEPATISRVPGVTSFVIDQPKLSGVERNNYGGWVGMEIRVGASDIVVTQLGRIVARGNSGVHVVKIVVPRTTPSTDPVVGDDAVSVNVTTIANLDESNVGTFAWAALPQPYTLSASTTYFIVSEEVNGGDRWFEEQLLPTTDVAKIQFSTVVRLTDPNKDKYQQGILPGHGYVPVSFRY